MRYAAALLLFALAACVRPEASTMAMLPNGHMGYSSEGLVIGSQDPANSRAIVQAILNRQCAGQADIKQLNLHPEGLTDSRYAVTAECL
jgi:hypothetical protein